MWYQIEYVLATVQTEDGISAFNKALLVSWVALRRLILACLRTNIAIEIVGNHTEVWPLLTGGSRNLKNRLAQIWKNSYEAQDMYKNANIEAYSRNLSSINIHSYLTFSWFYLPTTACRHKSYTTTLLALFLIYKIAGSIFIYPIAGSISHYQTHHFDTFIYILLH
jgi:hypothetical protein